MQNKGLQIYTQRCNIKKLRHLEINMRKSKNGVTKFSRYRKIRKENVDRINEHTDLDTAVNHTFTRKE
jgi:hypothetical protein